VHVGLGAIATTNGGTPHARPIEVALEYMALFSEQGASVIAAAAIELRTVGQLDISD